MFKKLKTNLVISNMLLVFGIVTMSFVAIFVFMQEMLERESTSNMKVMMYRNIIVSQTVNPPTVSDVDVKEEDFDLMNDTVRANDEAGYVYITYSSLGNVIVSNDIRYEIKNETLIEEFQKLVSSSELEGKCEYAGVKYRYILSKNSFPVGTYKIVFHNLTSENYFLQILCIGLIALDLVVSVISYMISLLITNYSIAPVKDAIDRQKQFTEDASHELRTPLTVMKTNMEVLKSEKHTTINDQYKWIEYMDDEISRMTDLVNDLLYLTRLDSDTHNEEMEVISLTEELFKIIEVYSKFVKNKGLTLESDIDKNVLLYGEIGKIKQLINIFLDNAIKYNKENGSIKILLKKNANTFDLIFKDTGVGIRKSDQKKIFNRFFRGDTSRATEGTGLGLSIAKGIIKKHNGSIRVISEENNGSEFIITFPYYKKDDKKHNSKTHNQV